EKSGGKFCENVQILNETISALEFSTTDEEIVEYESLWLRWLLISCLMAVLSIEWAIRKFRNLP
ncbi:hypothetical protein ACFLS1_04875, partial [Verrucomicrobiota bacterium]